VGTRPASVSGASATDREDERTWKAANEKVGETETDSRWAGFEECWTWPTLPPCFIGDESKASALCCWLRLESGWKEVRNTSTERNRNCPDICRASVTQQPTMATCQNKIFEAQIRRLPFIGKVWEGLRCLPTALRQRSSTRIISTAPTLAIYISTDPVATCTLPNPSDYAYL
jgi:hypothetical protein